jgi:hypothetical protein
MSIAWITLLVFTLSSMAMANVMGRLLFYTLTNESWDNNLAWFAFSAVMFGISELLSNMWIPKFAQLNNCGFKL